MWVNLTEDQVKRIAEVFDNLPSSDKQEQVEADFQIVMSLQEVLVRRSVDKEKIERFRQYAIDHYYAEGEVEFDDDAVVSYDADGEGAYVMGWRWIYDDQLNNWGKDT